MLPLFRQASVDRVPGVDPGVAGFAEICPPLLWAWRSRVPIAKAQLLLRYLRKERLGLEDGADLEALSKKVRVSYRTLEKVRTSLEVDDLSGIVLSQPVREISEKAEGRAVLSVLMLEETIRKRK
jgi:hypothetical protein